MGTTKRVDRVPILTICAKAPSGTNAAGTATPAMVNAVLTTGVPNYTRRHTETVQIAKVPSKPSGMSRFGFRVSSPSGDGFEPTVGRENDGGSAEYANHAVRRRLDPGEELPQRRLESAQSLLRLRSVRRAARTASSSTP
jgi:hypothetical protein